jgi:L-ascorbate metabolism protein UlaG (beta-lactamase superfamily)
MDVQTEWHGRRGGRPMGLALAVVVWAAAVTVVAGVAGPAAFAQEPTEQSKEGPDMLANVHWLGHAGIKITGDKVIYVDPYQIKGGEKADLILITHGHSDHLSPDDIAKIQGEQTIIVLPAGTKHHLSGRVESIKVGDEITLAGIKIRAVPAYNLGKKFHPQGQGNVGYVFTVGGVTFYHAGDTDVIPEMGKITADVAFLPVGGTYTMTADEAAQAAAMIKPKIAVPIHWGTIVGSRQDAETFQKKAGCEVRILSAE